MTAGRELTELSIAPAALVVAPSDRSHPFIDVETVLGAEPNVGQDHGDRVRRVTWVKATSQCSAWWVDRRRRWLVAQDAGGFRASRHQFLQAMTEAEVLSSRNGKTPFPRPGLPFVAAWTSRLVRALPNAAGRSWKGLPDTASRTGAGKRRVRVARWSPGEPFELRLDPISAMLEVLRGYLTVPEGLLECT